AMARWGRIVVAGVLAGALAPDARAAPPVAPAPNSACGFESAGTGAVARVLDGRSFVLDDGREIRLAGIEVPPASDTAGPHAEAAAAAKTALEAILLGRTVALSQHGVSDRYGRILAHVAADVRSVAGELVARGFARVAVHVGDAACAAELLKREAAARAQKLGLWGEQYYAVVGAENGAELSGRQGSFTVV